MTTFIVVGVVLVLLGLTGTPLFVLLAGLGLGLFWGADIDPAVMIIELNRLGDIPALIAVPLFTFGGYVLAESQAPRRLVQLFQALVGWVPGGLAVVALFATAFFTAFTGASGVTIIALGGILYPALMKDGYSERFSLGLMTTSGSLGLLFPPSLPIILYALVAKLNVDKLFLAGTIPGVLLLLVLSAYSILIGRSRHVSRIPFSGKSLLSAIRAAGWEIPVPFIVIGGIYGGIITATEAAAVTAGYVLMVEMFVHREISFRSTLPSIIRKSMILVGAIFIMLSAAAALTNYIVDQEIPQRLFEAANSLFTTKVEFLLVLNIILLGINMLEVFSAIIIFVPLIIPIALQYGIDPVHLGIIFLLNLEIGYMIPPLAINIFLSSLQFNKPLPEVYRAVIPFLVLLLLVLALVMYVPDVSTILLR
jgi:tripartite ATP-independent transporter DctM subunit